MSASRILTTTVLALAAGSALANSGFCTKGRLFVVDAEQPTLRSFDLDAGSLANGVLPPVALSLPDTRVYASSSGRVIIATGQGKTEDFWSDGSATFVDTGVAADVHSVLSGEGSSSVTKRNPAMHSFKIDCVRPIHVVMHKGLYGLFCDGAFDSNANSTAHFMYEQQIINGGGDSALLYSTPLLGQHHGVAVPIDSEHYLISKSTPERVAREEGSSALPNGFDVHDSSGALMYSLNKAEDLDSSCPGFHGSGHIGDSFAFGCEQGESGTGHGGVLLVQYDQQTESYASHKAEYPQLPAGYRVGSLADHSDGTHFVGALAACGSPGPAYLVSIPREHDGILGGPSYMLEQDVAQCAFEFELAGGLHLVWRPDGRLQVYDLLPRWTLLADIAALPGRDSCAGTTMVPGHGGVFVLVAEDGDGGRSASYSIDVTDLSSVSITREELPFVPLRGVVSGVPEGHSCNIPSVPAAPPTGRAAVSGFLHFAAGGPADSVLSAPGSNAAASFIATARHDVASALGVPLARVFVTDVTRGADGIGIAIGISVTAPHPTDVDQRTATELAAELDRQVVDIDGNSALRMRSRGVGGGTILGNVAFTAETRVVDGVLMFNDGAWPPGAIVAIILACVGAVGAVVGAAIYAARGKRRYNAMGKHSSEWAADELHGVMTEVEQLKGPVAA
jgi:hypothetical protein